MIHVTLLSVVLAAAAVKPAAPSARAFLRPAAATAPGCRATSEGDLVVVGLFAPEGQDCPIAKVGGEETIRLGELASALEQRHMSRAPRRTAGKPGEIDFAQALERLVTTRLLVL